MTDAEVEDYRTEMEGIKVGVYAFTSSLRHEFGDLLCLMVLGIQISKSSEYDNYNKNISKPKIIMFKMVIRTFC